MFLGHDKPMSPWRRFRLLTMVVLFVQVAPVSLGAAPNAPAHSPFLDDGLEITPTPRPAPRPSQNAEAASPWETPTQFGRAHGLRYGAMVHRKESIQAEGSLGLAHLWQTGRWWDLALAADALFPWAGQLEAQVHRVFSRSLLKPSLFLGLAVQPEPKNGLAFLVAPETTYVTFGFAMQDEWKKERALKVEFSGMSGLAGETKMRLLFYYLKLY